MQAQDFRSLVFDMDPAPRLSLIVPTLNEAEGIVSFLDEVLAVTEPVGGIEVVIVDDASRDGTSELARERIGDQGRVIVRTQNPGLSASVIDGWEQSRGQVLGVMDADLSHPPQLIPRMLAAIEQGGADIALGSRYVPGGGTEGWPWRRRLTSGVASGLARTLVSVHDPMSGFIFLRRQVIDGVELDPIGWKIALDVLVRGRYRRVDEVPFVFRDRTLGDSKLSGRVIREYLQHLVRLRAHLLKKGRLRR